MDNKQLITFIAVAVFVVLGFFALRNNETVAENMHMDMQAHQHENPQITTKVEHEIISFGELYSIDDNWQLKVIQFEPDARLSEPMGSGKVESSSDMERNPAIKIEFYKDGKYEHYQICFQTMPGMHSKKTDQKYFVDLLGYENMKKIDINTYTVNNVSIKISEVK
ncbi:MAG: hypothetical protein H8E64_03270 [Candidatus Marinimicrobia bacterium]|nr:hypothetical protein [Candidatus Neomarinimicrobiota bacterium]